MARSARRAPRGPVASGSRGASLREHQVWIVALYLLSAAALGKRIRPTANEEHRSYAPPGSFPRRPLGNGCWTIAVGSGLAVFLIVAAAMGWLTEPDDGSRRSAREPAASPLGREIAPAGPERSPVPTLPVLASPIDPPQRRRVRAIRRPCPPVQVVALARLGREETSADGQEAEYRHHDGSE